jgi:two-component system OmpR family response regulator
MSQHILIVEDEPSIAELISINLTHAGYTVSRALQADEALQLLRNTKPDLVILDWMMPGKSGVQFARELRSNPSTQAIPILMLTAKGEEADKVVGLDAGADDYVVKPFHVEELLARLRALLRRAAGHATSEIACGPVRVDTRASRVLVDGQPVKLTSHEYRLLAYLMHHQGRVVSRGELVEHLYDQDFDRDSNTIEVFVGRLRKKLGVDVIQTIRGLGYVLAAPGTR